MRVLHIVLLLGAVLALSSCSSDQVPTEPSTSAPSSVAVPVSTTAVVPTTEAPAPIVTTTQPPATVAPVVEQPPAPDVRCTDQINYAGDARSNAEINSIGERTGQCPAPLLPAPLPAPDERCTNQINYAGDTRSNAEINSIGEATGTCPTPNG